MTLDGEPSVFDSLVGALLPFGGGLVAIAHVYFDESGTHEDSRVMSMAGYWFDPVQAARFSRDWSKDLKRFGLTHAHMTDCALGFGEYKGLTLDQRIDSEKRLIEHITRRSSFGFGIAIRPDLYAEAMTGIGGAPTCYSLCLMTCVNKVADHAQEIGFKGKIAYFFEAGHQHASEAQMFMNHIPKLPADAIQRKQYGGHAFVEKMEAPPLQAADMFAWQLRHFYDRVLDGHTKMRADFAALVRPRDRHVVVDAKHLVGLREIIRQAGPEFNRGDNEGGSEKARRILAELGL